MTRGAAGWYGGKAISFNSVEVAHCGRWYYRANACNPPQVHNGLWWSGSVTGPVQMSIAVGENALPGAFLGYVTLQGTGTNPFGPDGTQTTCPTPTPTPTPTATPSAIATPTATLTVTPQFCSIFGCSNSTLPVDYGLNHLNQADAVDLVPIGATTGTNPYYLLSDLWPVEPQYSWLANIYSPIAGLVKVYIPPTDLRACSGCGDIRVRTGEGICYQFKHLVPDTNLDGLTISNGTQIGTVISADLDSAPGNGAGTQSHLHLDRYSCDTNFNFTGVAGGNIRDAVAYIVNR